MSIHKKVYLKTEEKCEIKTEDDLTEEWKLGAYTTTI